MRPRSAKQLVGAPKILAPFYRRRDAHYANPAPPRYPLGKYRHYKGAECEVIAIARHSETLEPMVVYRPLYCDGGLWVRPHTMFFERIEVAGASRPRFERLEDQDQ